MGFGPARREFGPRSARTAGKGWLRRWWLGSDPGIITPLGRAATRKRVVEGEQWRSFLITIAGMLRRAVTVALVVLIALGFPAFAGGPQKAPAEEFSNDVVSRLLQQVTQGLITHNQRQMLSAFDPARMKNYAQFRDNLAVLFAKYESFRAAYRLRQSWPQGERGVIIADFELEGSPLEEGSPPFRRSAQLRFEFERGRKGWRIVDATPRAFFSQT